jgi:hypothetical protein
MNEQRLLQAGASAFLEKARLLDKPRDLLDTVEQVLKPRSDGRDGAQRGEIWKHCLY